jgi:hypothetical protein
LYLVAKRLRLKINWKNWQLFSPTCTSDYTLWNLHRPYIKEVSANIELQVNSVTCSWPYFIIVIIISISLLMSPLLGHRPSLLITHKEKGHIPPRSSSAGDGYYRKNTLLKQDYYINVANTKCIPNCREKNCNLILNYSNNKKLFSSCIFIIIYLLGDK